MTFFVKDFCETVQARVVIFGMQVDNDILYHGIFFPVFVQFSFFSILWMMKFFVKDFCETMLARVVIFGMQVDNDVLYRGIANQPSPAYSFLYLSDFLSFHTLNDELFLKDFSETVQARVFIFGMQVDNDVLYRRIVNQPSPAYSSLYLSFFLSLYIFRQIYLHNCIE